MIVIFLLCGILGLAVTGSMVDKGLEMRDEMNKIEKEKDK